ncbi:hypothetical protein LCGC14_0572830 [marine sediment metagenome]|uniref:Uncharacterized protein n=1 Tax=marine sediment metagenome TaxID=412755 RepID=A0A0F9S2B5_9ZZZZ
MDPVSCKKGHLNDPYPESGRCGICNNYLPGNRDRFDSKRASASRNLQTTGEKANLETAMLIVEDDGFKWDEIGEGNRTLVTRWVEAKDRPAYELYLEQMKRRQARPKATEETEDTVIEVHVSDALLESLEVLRELQREAPNERMNE